MAAILATPEQGGVRTGTALVAPAANNFSFSCRWYWDGTVPPTGEYFTIHLRKNTAYTDWHWLGFNELGNLQLNAGTGSVEIFSISTTLTVAGWYSIGYTYNTVGHVHSLYVGIGTSPVGTAVSDITALTFDDDYLGTDESGIWFAAELGNTRQWSAPGAFGEAVLTGSELSREANASTPQRTTHIWSSNPLTSDLLDYSVPAATTAATFATSTEGLVRTPSVLAASSPYTISFWASLATTPVSLGGRNLLYRGDDPVSFTEYLWLGQLPDGTVKFDASGSDFVTGVIALGRHCFQYTYDPGTFMHTVYIDGVLAGSTVKDINAYTFTHEYLGTDTYADDWSSGWINYARIWSDDLSALELAAERISAAAVRLTDRWLDTPLTTDLLDDSGNGRDWTAYTGPTTFTTPSIQGGPTRNGRDYTAVDGPLTFTDDTPPSNRYYPLAHYPRTRVEGPMEGSWNSPMSFGGRPWNLHQFTWCAKTDKTSQALGPVSNFFCNQFGDFDWSFVRWRFGPFDAFTIDTAFNLCLLAGAMFENVGLSPDSDVRYKLHIYITVGETKAVRTVLLDNYVDATSLRKSILSWWQPLSADQQLGPAAVQDGDCLMIEFGYRVVSSPATTPATYPPTRYTKVTFRTSGANPAVVDSLPGETNSSRNPWFQFTQTFPLKAASAPPANDDCVDATAITLTPATRWESGDIDTTGAVLPARDVFFTWTAPAAGRVIFTARGTNYQALINIFTNGCTQTISPLNFSLETSMSSAGASSVFAFDALQGQAYLIRIRSNTSTIASPGSGGLLRLQGFYREDPQADDLFVPNSGFISVYREGVLISVSMYEFSAAPVTGISFDYTKRPMLINGGGGATNMTDRVLVGLFPFDAVSILDPFLFSTNDEEVDFIFGPLQQAVDVLPAQNYVTAAGMLYQGMFGNGFLYVDAQGGSLVAFLNAISSLPAYSAVNEIDAIDGDNQAGAPFTATRHTPAVEVTTPWCLGMDEASGILYYTSGTLYIPVGGQQIRRYDVNSAVDLGVWATLPVRSCLVPGVRGVQFIGGGQVLVCNGDVVHLLNSGGTITQTYTPSVPEEAQALIDVRITADGTAFWVIDNASTRLFKFDLASGSELLTFQPYLGAGNVIQMVLYQPNGITPPPSGRRGCPVVFQTPVGGGQACLPNALLAASTFIDNPLPVPPPPVYPPAQPPIVPEPDPAPDPVPVPDPAPNPAPQPDPDPAPQPDPDPDPPPSPIPDPDPEPEPPEMRLQTTTTVQIVGTSFVYNGQAYTPAVVTVQGAGLLLHPQPTYLANVNAGIATASYSYPGDATYLPSSGQASFTIEKAPTTTVVTVIGGPSFAETGSPITPAVVGVSGAGGLSLSPTPNYANNTLPGTATASYSYPGAANYLPSSDSETFTITPAAPDPPPPDGIFAFSDFSHLGTIVLPGLDSDDQAYYGQGIAAYRQPADGNQIHLVVGAFRQSPTRQWPLYEVRYHTPQNPTDPTDLSQYTRATIVKQYGYAPYIGIDGFFKRLTKISGVEVEANASSGPDFFGIGFGPDGKLYQTWVLTYSDGSDPNTYNVMRSVLDYANPAASYGEGPWGVDIHENKPVGKSVMLVPQAYANSYLGGKRIALGGGGYPSIASAGDASYGLSLTAVPVPTTQAEKSDLTGTGIMGYWPYAATPGVDRDRMTRPALQANFLDGEGSWGLDKFTWDQIEGGSVWIDNGVKQGVIGFCTLSLGAIDYLFSAPAQQSTAMYWFCFDPRDFKPVAGGNRWDAQPVWWQKVNYPGELRDYETVTTLGTASTITSTAGVGKNNNGLTGAHVNWTAHGRVAGDWIVILNNSRTEYNGIWAVSNVVNANELTIWSPNDAGVWSGIAGTGGTITTTTGQSKLRHQGSCTFEDLLFVRWSREGLSAGQHASFVEVYQLPTTPQGNIYYVAPTGNDANDGSINAPKLRISAGVALCNPGDVLYIRGGIYSHALDVIDSALYTVGKGTSWSAPITIAGYPGETVTLRPPSNTHAVRLTNGDQYLVLEDLILDYVNDASADGREGVYISNASHHIRHRRVRVTNCNNFGVVFTSSSLGFNEFLDGEIDHCGRNDPSNDIARGHGSYVSCGDNLFEGNRVHDNAGYGHHFFNNSGPKLVARNTVRRERIYANGLLHSTAYGLVFSWGADNLAWSCLIHGNRDGAFLYNESQNAQIYNCTITGNVQGGLVAELYRTAPIVSNTLVWGNGSGITDQGGYAGAGSLVQSHNHTSGNPLFVGGGDYHLTASSPCRDAGVPLPVVTTDFDGKVRPQGVAYCIGAYEYVTV